MIQLKNEINIIQRNLSLSQVNRYFNENIELFPRIVSGEIEYEAFIKKITQNAVHFCAFFEDELVGFLAIYLNHPKKEYGYISTISVQKIFQNKGIAKRLMIESINFAKKNGFKEIKLEVAIYKPIALNINYSLGFIVEKNNINSYIMNLTLSN